VSFSIAAFLTAFDHFWVHPVFGLSGAGFSVLPSVQAQSVPCVESVSKRNPQVLKAVSPDFCLDCRIFQLLSYRSFDCVCGFANPISFRRTCFRLFINAASLEHVEHFRGRERPSRDQLAKLFGVGRTSSIQIKEPCSLSFCLTTPFAAPVFRSREYVTIPRSIRWLDNRSRTHSGRYNSV
jgi:hypothetical protein